MSHKTSTKQQIQPLTLEGTPYQRGLAHGETLRSQIQELIGIWKADLSAVFRTGADQHLHTFLQRTEFLSAIQQWTPDLLDEIRGIADGSALPFESLLAFQLLDELWAYTRPLPSPAAPASASAQAEACALMPGSQPASPRPSTSRPSARLETSRT
jgi:hypothetical protein